MRNTNEHLEKIESLDQGLYMETTLLSTQGEYVYVVYDSEEDIRHIVIEKDMTYYIYDSFTTIDVKHTLDIDNVLDKLVTEYDKQTVYDKLEDELEEEVWSHFTESTTPTLELEINDKLYYTETNELVLDIFEEEFPELNLSETDKQLITEVIPDKLLIEYDLVIE